MDVPLRAGDGRITVEGGGELSPLDLDIPGDLSSAAYLMALAVLLPGSSLAIQNVGTNPTRSGLITLLKRMGAGIEISERERPGPEPVGDIRVESTALSGISIGGEDAVAAIDELPLLAVVATQADGQTTVRGAAELRVKESDRIKAITEGLRRMGAEVEEMEDGLTVNGPVRLRGATCDSHGDLLPRILLYRQKGPLIVN
jgi:3-phosphoshikimate 1-carboxyvinyltransferase